MATNATIPASTPTRAPPKKQGSASVGKQSSILGFFSKASAPPSSSPAPSSPAPTGTSIAKRTAKLQDLTPVPSSDAAAPSSDGEDAVSTTKVAHMGLPSPTTPAEKVKKQGVNGAGDVAMSSPSRRVSDGRQTRLTAKGKGRVNYVESDDDEIVKTSRRQRASRRQTVVDDDDFEQADEAVESMDDGKCITSDALTAEMDDFIVSDDSDAPPKKRKRAVSRPTARKRANMSPPPMLEEDEDEEMPTASSTAQQWKYDPDNTQPLQPRSSNIVQTPKKTDTKKKEKAHKTEPEQRYSWLANVQDIDRNPVGHPDHDPRTIYIPPLAWAKFTAFEKQYWEIKQKWWDTIVFFKKGKFYELYEHDATIGHQLFDLKLTDRVNMRMVGVPEASLDNWANQFVAKGFKIAIVNQVETALGKEMRERDNSTKGKVDKVIRRELSTVLTGGTLVEGSMLQDDMATFCVAIKEDIVDDLPAFGIAFVDTATGQFFLSDFVDDVDLTKFETLIAQIRPQEILLEKSNTSTKAMRILKNNTTPTTLWNHLKPGVEFWSATITRCELEAGDYFKVDDKDVWPEALEAVKNKDNIMSAMGALMQYLKTLKLERDLLTQGNFTLYDPIMKATTLVLDGQTLINLEVFANSYDGGAKGTLFSLLNRCVTPFGKRMFRQWVCHPLADARRINERLDAVDFLNSDHSVREQFTAQMTKMPDLERLISRVHAGICKPEDFVQVLEGFEQIEYTMSMLGAFAGGDGVLDRLITAMPNLVAPLEFWKTAFDRKKARAHNLLIPERGIDDSFDESQDTISDIEGRLQDLLKAKRKQYGSNAMQFKDVGKEIYQLEVPTKVKGIPKDWSLVSSAKDVKRYYFSELKALVREYQEAQERHTQTVKELSSRFFARFDQDYSTWLAAVKVVAQLDCLISLAKASSSLGEPSCRPVFVDDDRSVVEFEELRHPCMLPSVSDFIPNDVKLGGERPNINLLTGANAAGKSTVLRMTCVAVIMAQIGCYVPCVSARLTPVDRIMSRLGANDNIFAAQSTFFVELSETKKILAEATPRSLVILDELGRGTSSYDGVAVAQAVLHHIATHVRCVGFFATHYHSLATEFAGHPEIAPTRMQIAVDDALRRVTFLYKLEPGVAAGSFGMHCASMCGIPAKVVDRAEVAAKLWEHTSRVKESLERARSACYVPLGVQSDVAWVLREGLGEGADDASLHVLMKAIEAL